MSKDQSKAQLEFKYLVFGLVLSALAYILGSWAIDSGSLLVYGLTFLSVFYSFRFYLVFIKVVFFKNDKAKPLKRTSSKTSKG